MKTATAWATETSFDAIQNAYQRLLKELGDEPSTLVVSFSVSYDATLVLKAIRELSPNVPVQGASSCLGAMTQDGFHSNNGSGLSFFGILDPEGSYGVSASMITDNAKQAAKDALEQALVAANCAGEVPAMIWLTAAPGFEEQLMEGIAEVVGDGVPIAGGSSADNTVTGEWKQFSGDTVYDNAVVVGAMFPSTEIMFAFHSGYEPTDNKGKVTKISGRTLSEIDHRPAAEVYNEWTSGLISKEIATGGNILAATSLHPLGRVAGHIGKIPYFQLTHPNAVLKKGALSLFTDMAIDDEIVLMQGSVDSLVSRAARVASSAKEMNPLKNSDVAGALIIYCAGCMLTVKDKIDEVVHGLKEELPDTPFMGSFTFGEQGCFVGGENRHGNLMISVLLFTD
ncbi:MAG: FIST N-terminal domain-containing protein [Nitrospirota bacterium]|nr:FIST N-terminal domain-containing protein [Nitrospirota bacterium]